MKPRANLGNRTRQPKGCASRIAKPARLDRTSQNHLMMIILNKTGATTVAQLDFETLAIHTQSETRGCRRHVLCANFSKTRALFLLLSHRPQQKGRAGGSPTGVFVAWRNVGTSVRLCFGVSCGIARACSFVCDHGRAHHVSHVVPMTWPWPWRQPSLCRRRVVATRRWMLVFAMVLVWSALTQFALHT